MVDMKATLALAVMAMMLSVSPALADESQFIRVEYPCSGFGCLSYYLRAFSVVPAAVPGDWQLVASTQANTCPYVSWTCPVVVERCEVQQFQTPESPPSSPMSQTTVQPGGTYIYDRYQSGACYSTWMALSFYARTFSVPVTTTTTTQPAATTTTLCSGISCLFPVTTTTTVAMPATTTTQPPVPGVDYALPAAAGVLGVLLVAMLARRMKI